MGGSSVSRLSRAKASMNHCWISCSLVPPLRTLRPISLKASATIESTLSRAAKCDWICSSVQVDSNCATRSAELTMFFPSPRSRSTVPASTREIVKTLLLGEYCIARSRCLASINFVDQFDRVAFRRNQIEPAPGHHHACGQTQHAICDGIAVMVVVEEPSVDIALAKGGLNRREVHGQNSIVNNRMEFGRVRFVGSNLAY